MPKRTTSHSDVIAPQITPQRGVELLTLKLDDIEKLKTLGRNAPEYQQWKATTEAVIKSAFGEPNEMRGKFINTIGSFLMNMPDRYYEQQHIESLDRKAAILRSAIEQLQILAPPIAQVAPGTYQFHSEIERVAGRLFRDGHYKQAALEAYIRVIDQVKVRSGLPLDGDGLMNQAFGCDGGRVPTLKFNSLNTESEKDEQKGFMYLFKGIVGLRNSKAHSNALFNDPLRAHDYLSLASLLMRVLELATK